MDYQSNLNFLVPDILNIDKKDKKLLNFLLGKSYPHLDRDIFLTDREKHNNYSFSNLCINDTVYRVAFRYYYPAEQLWDDFLGENPLGVSLYILRVLLPYAQKFPPQRIKIRAIKFWHTGRRGKSKEYEILEYSCIFGVFINYEEGELCSLPTR